jgi:hypothetical protein
VQSRICAGREEPSRVKLGVLAQSRLGHALTRTTSNCLAVGGKSVSDLALTTARRLPKRAAVVGSWNGSR